MPRVDFYLLNQTDNKTLGLYACRLINKVYQRRHKIYVHCSSENEAHHLDELLWTYQDDSFIPHHLRGEGPNPPPPVQLGYGEQAPAFFDILLNMDVAIPPFFQQFQRVLEIVSADSKQRETSREHYRIYRDAGFVPAVHEVTSGER